MDRFRRLRPLFEQHAAEDPQDDKLAEPAVKAISVNAPSIHTVHIAVNYDYQAAWKKLWGLGG